jgi:hypothetical protein
VRLIEQMIDVRMDGLLLVAALLQSPGIDHFAR